MLFLLLFHADIEHQRRQTTLTDGAGSLHYHNINIAGCIVINGGPATRPISR